MNKNGKYLPIGSIVRLKGAQGLLMIAGFCVKNSSSEDSAIYDYVGYQYPFGIISNDINYIFNHEQIEELLFTGYDSELEQNFKNQLLEKVNELSDEKTNNINGVSNTNVASDTNNA